MRPTLLAAAALLAASTGHAAITLTVPSAVYGNTFDGLAASGNANAWVNDGTLPGWYLFAAGGATPPAITTYRANSGADNAGAFYSFGSAAADRALGGVGSAGAYFGAPPAGAIAGYIAVAFTNGTGLELDSFTARFDGEQWRNGGNVDAQPMVLSYGFGASFASVTNWVSPGGNFDWVSPVTGSTAAAVDGNTAGLVANRGGTIATTWAPGETLWLRWTERNDFGSDHGLAIDNFTFSVTAVPEPGTWALLLAGIATVGFVARRRG